MILERPLMRGVLGCKVIEKSRAALASIFWMQGRRGVSAAGLEILVVWAEEGKICFAETNIVRKVLLLIMHNTKGQDCYGNHMECCWERFPQFRCGKNSK